VFFRVRLESLALRPTELVVIALELMARTVQQSS
jgi:hypothetical protein